MCVIAVSFVLKFLSPSEIYAQAFCRCLQFCFVFPSTPALKSLLVFSQSAIVHLIKDRINQRHFISNFSSTLLYHTPTESFCSCLVLHLELLYNFLTGLVVFGLFFTRVQEELISIRVGFDDDHSNHHLNLVGEFQFNPTSITHKRVKHSLMS